MKRIKLSSFFAAAALALFLGSCANDDIVQKPGGSDDNNTEEVTFEAGTAVPTRTTMSNTGAFKWQAGDRIWVKDDTGAWQQSSNAPTSETDNFKFKVPGTFTGSNTYTVYYPGKNGNRDKVTISASQSQADPNTPVHVGVSGDCGWATATKVASAHRFNFTLEHKAAFLVFSPYCNNNSVISGNDVKLTRIEVTSDNNLVGTYTLDPATNQLTGTGSGKQINLTTTGGSATPNGFSVPTSATPATNASYVVIKPGTHTLKVRFWLKDNTANVIGTITKLYPSFTYAANMYYTMPSELHVKDYTPPYYMWDAQQPYWYGHEWNKAGYVAGTDQPTVNGNTGSAYPQSGDARYYNTTITGVGEGTHGLFNPSSAQHVPNANEMSWYCMEGDPRWDNYELWTTMGRLYHGGMWFKKKANISGFRSDKAADNFTDMRVVSKTFNKNSISIDTKPLTPADLSNYFYLPTLGVYSTNMLLNVGSHGVYWSSTASPSRSDKAYELSFYGGRVSVSESVRHYGYSVQALE